VLLSNHGVVLEFHVHLDAIKEYIERSLAPCDNIFSQLCEKNCLTLVQQTLGHIIEFSSICFFLFNSQDPLMC
jgi:hypothetical protein